MLKLTASFWCTLRENIWGFLKNYNTMSDNLWKIENVENLLFGDWSSPYILLYYTAPAIQC